MSGNQEEFIQVPRSQYDLHANAATLLNKLLTNPKVAPKAEELIAQVNPNATFPGREIREAYLEPVNARFEQEKAAREALQKRLDDREAAEAAARQKAQEDAMMDRLNALKTKRGFSDELVTKVMERMRDQNNPDVDAAAALVAESIPKPSAASGLDYLGGNVDVYGSASGDSAWEGLHKDPTNWLTQELRNIAHDPEFARLGNAA